MSYNMNKLLTGKSLSVDRICAIVSAHTPISMKYYVKKKIIQYNIFCVIFFFYPLWFLGI